MPPILPFAEFAPDQPDLADATDIASGCIALTAQSYGPLSSLSAFSTNALETECLGMIGCDDVAQVSHIFAGTAANLYRNEFGSTLWNNVGSGYTTGAGENWRFAQFKSLILATNFTNPIQSYDMSAASPFGTLSVGAPTARHIAVAKDFAIVGNTNDPTGGLNPYRIWWSAVGDPTSWPTPGSAQAQQVMSDYNDMVGPQGAITGLAANLAGCDCAVFFERGVFRMFFSGPPSVFSFYPAQGVRGCQASNSIVVLGDVAYYLDEDGFYAFDGFSATPIGAQKIDKWFAANVDWGRLDLIIGAADVNNKAIVWAFKSTQTSAQTPDILLIYRWDIKRWSYAPISAQWLTRVAVPETIGPSVPNVFGLTAGRLQLSAVNAAGYLAFFNGPFLPAQIGTKVVQITPGRRSWVSSARPLVGPLAAPALPITTETEAILTTEDGTELVTESGFAPIITVAMSGRTNYQDQEIFGPEVAINNMGECPQRVDARYHRGRVSIGSGIWANAVGLELTARPGGLR